MTVMTVDVGHGLCHIEFAEHFHLRKCTEQKSKSIGHEAPVVCRVSMDRVRGRNRHNQCSPWLEHAMALVYDPLWIVTVLQHLRTKHKIVGTIFHRHDFRVAYDI